MGSLADLIMRLEKRIFVLEKALGIEPDKNNLVHPKSLKQAEARAKQTKVEK